MKKFVDIIKEFEDFTSLGGASEAQVKEAEEELGVKFNKEYRDFLVRYGTATANGHEFLGICDIKRLNIIESTVKEKSKNKNMPEDIYLIEDVGIDKILTWQNTNGELYQTVGVGIPEKIQSTLCEYVGS